MCLLRVALFTSVNPKLNNQKSQNRALLRLVYSIYNKNRQLTRFENLFKCQDTDISEYMECNPLYTNSVVGKWVPFIEPKKSIR